MLQGVCVDPGQTEVLEKGKTYYLFLNGNEHYYVSVFPSQNAHKGCFQTKYFQVIERDSYPQEPAARPIHLDPNKVYKADLIWAKPGYRPFTSKEYYIKPRTTHGYFYHDINLTKPGGCFPLHWFDNFIEIDVQVSVTVPIVVESVMKLDKIEPTLNEIVHEISKSEQYEQLSLF
jgi:hypothetical protein